jgi:hypothetical protein
MVLDPARPCSGERPLLMFDRWRKLLKSFWSDKKSTFDISKIPDIYDSAKYDAIHNEHLGLKALPLLYRDARAAANAVIPNEYGLAPAQRLDIGGKIAAELLGKLLADLESMREESLATAAIAARSARQRARRLQRRREARQAEGLEDDEEDEDDWEEDDEDEASGEWMDEEEDGEEQGGTGGGAGGNSSSRAGSGADFFDDEFGRMSIEDGRLYSASVGGGGAAAGAKVAAAVRQLQAAGSAGRLERLPEGGAEGGAAEGEGGDDAAAAKPEGGSSGARTPERETLHRLCPTYAADVNSPLRHVRTRVYFTSESHMHSLINVLRYCHLGGGQEKQDKEKGQKTEEGAAPAAAAGGANGDGANGANGGAAAGSQNQNLSSSSPASPPPTAASSCEPLLSDAGLQQLDRTPELDYLTHVVLRMFEDKAAPLESPDRFFVEVLFSAGANRDPTAYFASSPGAGAGGAEGGAVLPTDGGGEAAAAAAAQATSGTLLHVLPPLPRVALHPGRGVALDRASRLLSRYAAARGPAAPAYALKSALRATE